MHYPAPGGADDLASIHVGGTGGPDEHVRKIPVGVIQEIHAYRAELQQLDSWIQGQVTQIPQDRRKLVTDHQVFGYFADRYGFEQLGAVIPSFTAAAEPSAQQLAALENSIKKAGVQAIFVGKTVNPILAQRIASDTGTKLVALYTGSLTEPGGEADSYIALMRYDVAAIVEALK